MPEPLNLPELYQAPEQPGYGWRWNTSRTGRSLARVENYASTARVAEKLARTGPAIDGAGQVTVVLDGEDSAEFARAIGRGCRRRGRFVVHASPRHSRPARAQSEVLRALGKDWDWAAQGGTATLALLVRVWLRAERARDLIVLRAGQVHGRALAWLIATAVAEGLRLWLITAHPLAGVHEATATTVRESHPADALAALEEYTDCRPATACECEDLSHPAPAGPRTERRLPPRHCHSGVAHCHFAVASHCQLGVAPQIPVGFDLENVQLSSDSRMSVAGDSECQ